MKFSLIVCSLNRQELILKCLDSLLNQSFFDFEIIVVDQSKKQYVLPETIYKSIKYFHIQEKGLSHARNYAVAKSSGDYLCLIDDDAVYQKDFLLNASRHIDSNDLAIIGGKMIDPETGKTKTNKKSAKIWWGNAFKYLTSPCMIVRRDILLTHNFDERFGVGSTYGCGEESDIVLYCLSRKEKVFYYDDFVVFHPVGTKGSLERIYSYSVGHGALFFKTSKLYSCFWGKYYYFKSILGNFLRMCLYTVIFKRSKYNETKTRMKGVASGYKIARKDISQHV